MPAVIVDMPWPPTATNDLRRSDGSVVIDPATGGPVRVFHDQLILWATLAPVGWPSPSGLPPFPVLLDTGFNDTFLIQEQQADGWLGQAVVARFLTTGKRRQVGRDVIEGRNADLWLFPNVPGTRDRDPRGTPVRLELPGGALLTPAKSGATKDKPLLGLQAIRHNGLTVRLDGLARRVSVDTS